MTARFMTSGLRGVLNMVGSLMVVTRFPLRLKTLDEALPIFGFPLFYPCFDSRDIWMIFGEASGVSFGGLAGYLSLMARFAGPGRLPSSST